jgi:hypothetical protein
MSRSEGEPRANNSHEWRVQRVCRREGDMQKNVVLLERLQVLRNRLLLVEIEELELPHVHVVIDGFDGVPLLLRVRFQDVLELGNESLRRLLRSVCRDETTEKSNRTLR